MMLLQRFKDKLNEWDIKYKGFNVSILPNWTSDWKTCLAYRWKTSYKWTEDEIYELLYWYERAFMRKEIIEKYFKNN